MKKEVFELPKSRNAGIYMLYNLTKHKVYIGKTQNFRSRATHHAQQLKNNAHSNKALQADFNNGCEFAFAILNDAGCSCDKEALLFREKQYIYAFREKHIKVYNQETHEQLVNELFYHMVWPAINEIHSNFHKKFGCQIATLQRCKTSTIKEKFEEKI